MSLDGGGSSENIKPTQPHKLTRRRFVKGLAALGATAVVESQTKVLQRAGKWLKEDIERSNREYDATKAAKASIPTPSPTEPPTPEPTSTPTARETEVAHEMTSSWTLYNDLMKDENVDEYNALSLLPDALRVGTVEATLDTFNQVLKKDVRGIDPNYAAIVTPTIRGEGISIDDAAQIIEDSISATSNGLFSFPETGVPIANVAMRYGVPGKEVYERYMNARGQFGRDGALAFIPLIYAGYEDQVKQGWQEIRDATHGRYGIAVDGAMTIGKVLSGDSAEATIESLTTTKEAFPDISYAEAALLAVAKIANGHSQAEVSQMQNYFTERLDENDLDKRYAAPLTLQTILRNPELPAFQQLQTTSGGLDGYIFYRTFIDPTSPLSPFYMF